jgi:hypothetical protein
MLVCFAVLLVILFGYAGLLTVAYVALVREHARLEDVYAAALRDAEGGDG